MLSGPCHHRLTLKLWFRSLTAPYDAASLEWTDAVKGNTASSRFLSFTLVTISPLALN